MTSISPIARALRPKMHGRKSGKKIDLTIPNPDAPPGASAVHTERHAFASPEAAKAGATSRMATLNRHTSTSRLTMRGRADLSAEKTIALKGFKTGVDGEFLIESVEHTFASRGWITVVTLNRGGTRGKRRSGTGRRRARRSIWWCRRRSNAAHCYLKAAHGQPWRPLFLSGKGNRCKTMKRRFWS